MKLMEEILSEKNLKMAIKKVKQNKGALGVDKMTVQEVEQWFEQYREELISKMMNKQYRPMPVKRVYIPKPNGKQRPLGIPTVVDRVIQQAAAKTTGLRRITKEILAKRGLISCVDYYLNGTAVRHVRWCERD
ncbi:hypothetical protein QUV96_02035 [Amedibacillus dolichus]|uniref:Group II intron reverse transcriptase/maturase n=1 Tax=Amedibacillus dolichus TaxID=31971 RepID=A0ABT7U9X7_9FIRM|nr:hypothetical protein [Amedibacillus dolichus]MDM8156414.1 hypothetical protein [Amedibacillus dolichus]